MPGPDNGKDKTKAPAPEAKAEKAQAQAPEPAQAEAEAPKAKREPPKPTVLDGLRAAGLTMELGGREIPAPRAAGLLHRNGLKPGDPLPEPKDWAKALNEWQAKPAGADAPKPAAEKKEG